MRQEAEAGLGSRHPALAREHGVELGLQRVQVEHVGGGVVLLLVGELVGAPVGALLLLGQVDAEQLPAQVLEAVAVGVGARQLGGDLGAVDGPGHRRPGAARAWRCRSGAKWKILSTAGIGQQRLEARRRPVLAVELHQMGAAVAGRELHQAQPVAVRLEAQRLGVDGDASR